MTERATEFISTDTVITFEEYLLLLCQMLDAVEQTEKETKNETENENDDSNIA